MYHFLIHPVLECIYKAVGKKCREKVIRSPIIKLINCITKNKLSLSQFCMAMAHQFNIQVRYEMRYEMTYEGI